jgi:hypothetical protein
LTIGYSLTVMMTKNVSIPPAMSANAASLSLVMQSRRADSCVSASYSCVHSDDMVRRKYWHYNTNQNLGVSNNVLLLFTLSVYRFLKKDVLLTSCRKRGTILPTWCRKYCTRKGERLGANASFRRLGLRPSYCTYIRTVHD